MTNALFIHADARHIPLADSSVQCVVTSPPYWGLRDYGLEPSVWGGDPECEHVWYVVEGPGQSGGTKSKKVQIKGQDNFQAFSPSKQSFCQHCGAWRGCLGLELTPEMYVAHIVEIFREVKRLLRKDGTLWLNLGDRYRKKRLIGVPWRVALALQADGWWLRSDIIWHKSNVMPESVKDRPTKAHEYMFILAKSAQYYYNREAVREPIKPSSLKRWPPDSMRVESDGWTKNKENARINPTYITAKTGPLVNPSGRNRRTVWTIPTRPYKGAHFATFPPDLVEICVLAGSAPGDVVLDPFCGSGTTGVVAVEHGRRFVGLDLNRKYLTDLAIERVGETQKVLS